MCKTFPFFGSERGLEAIKKIEALNGNTSNKDTIAWFYSVLNILDAKANSLLRVNSMFITFLAFFLGAARTSGNPLKITQDQAAAAVLALIIVMVSTIFCFLIVRVNWRFLGHVVQVEKTIDNKPVKVYDFENEAKRLAKVVDDRTRFYWIGWLLTLIVVVLPALLWFHFPPLIWFLQYL
jgi:hypothetical protein